VSFHDARRMGFGFFHVSVDFVLLRISENFFACRFRYRGFVRVCDVFSGQFNYGRATAIALSDRRRLFVGLAVIVIFQIFENVADIQEGIAV
jgi:hypothetical protein